MAKGGRQSSLLAEIVIAVLFFALSATVILDVFAMAYGQSAYSGALNESMADAQNLSERIYAADDAAALLESEGFVEEDGTWMLEKESYDLHVVLSSEETGAGELRTARIVALRGDDTLLDLPCARYFPGEVAR